MQVIKTNKNEYKNECKQSVCSNRRANQFR